MDKFLGRGKRFRLKEVHIKATVFRFESMRFDLIPKERGTTWILLEWKCLLKSPTL